jgi:hypothetical protein
MAFVSRAKLRQENIAEWLDTACHHSVAPLERAVRAVLDLTPPDRLDPTDELEEAAESGWWTCQETVMRAIADVLGVEPV